MSDSGEIPGDEQAPAEETHPSGATAGAYMAAQQDGDEATESESDAMEVDETPNDDAETEEAEEAAPTTQADAPAEEDAEEQPMAEEETLETDNVEMQDSEVIEETAVAEEEEVESSTKDDSESVTRSSRSQTAEEPSQPTYSTRGRYQKEEDPLEALLAGVRAQGEEEREMMTATATATSFLESLNEEDRRTRTRHLPDVQGFHPLYKNEVKSDLALARSITSSSGQSSTLSKRKGKRQKDENQMDIDGAEGTGPSEDERVTESGSGKVVDFDHREFTVPSKVFVAPKSDGIDGAVPSGKPSKNQLRSPFVVEAITAYNPPRLPESAAAKKKHRMLRWERRPQDIDVDLSNYKKTVRRTREELQNAEKERERIQMFGAIMRIHYRDQLELLNEESLELNEELSSIQTECVAAADLITSRTRSRGAGKGSYLMRDVMAVLKQRGVELAEKGLPALAPEEGGGVPGFGGVTSFGFIDWDRATDVPVQKLAVGWTLPGDKVATPYGDGVALHVFGPSILDVDEALPIDLRPKPSPTPTNGNKETSPDTATSGQGAAQGGDDGDVVMEPETTPDEEAKQDGTAQDGDTAKSNEPAAAASKEAKGTEENGKKADSASKPAPEKAPEKAPDKTPSSKPDNKKEYRMEEILAPRICVQLPFGVGFFPVSEVKSKENPAFFSDAKLASRWNKMIETSALVGSFLDVAGMESVARASVVDRDYKIQSSMEMDEDSEENASGTEAKVVSNEVLDKPKRRPSGSIDVVVSASERFVPYGANLLPTDAGRGSLLAKAPLTALEGPIQEKLFHAGGALGAVRSQLSFCPFNFVRY